MSKLTAVSLFCGVGGIDIAFENAGVEVIFANDHDKNACITYRNNFNNVLLEKDIEELEASEVPNTNMILFGFPCTSFSIAGYRKGFEDEHTGHLFFEALRIIKEKKPDAIFIENVKNLVSHDKGKTFRIIQEALKENGYYIRYQIMNSCDYGNIPQNRERIYIVGFKDKEKANNFYFPDPIPLTTTIEELTNPDSKKPKRFYYTPERTKYYPLLKENVTKKNTFYQLRRVYVRENKSNLCPTLTANMGTGGHNVPLILDDFGIRQLTPQECFDFQGFPNDFKLPDLAVSHLYKQAGNSVVVPVVTRIAKNMVEALNIK